MSVCLHFGTHEYLIYWAMAGGHGLWPGLWPWLVARAPLAQAYGNDLWPGLWSWLVAGSQGSLGPDLWPWLVAKAQSYGHGHG